MSSGAEPATGGGAVPGGRPPGAGSAPGGLASSSPLLGRAAEPTIFEMSVPGRSAWSLRTTGLPEWELEELVPLEHRRRSATGLPEVSERDLVAHFTRLSQRQYSVDTGAYPLGSCTMKYNPKLFDHLAALPGFADAHPASPTAALQGFLALLVRLEEMLCEITGMAAATLQPPAGAAGELTGLLMMRAWHGRDAGDGRGRVRRRVLIPDSAHGTNPASVSLAGYEATTVASDSRGLLDVASLREHLDDDVAGIMLTNPNTLGLFEEDIVEIASAVHDAGALLYYDGANLNPVLGVARPGDMGFDIVHLNLHKTFATPHGGGGPGAGPVAVTAELAPYLPAPRPVRTGEGGRYGYGFAGSEASIGRAHSWHGNALVLQRALAYIMFNGGDGLRRVAEAAVLNASWLSRRLRASYDIPYGRPSMHEFVASAASLKRSCGLSATDVAKALLERGFHAPTVHFPLIVDEALMIEPTETESPQTLDALARAFEDVAREALSDGAASARSAPRSTPVGRVDETRAARRLVLTVDQRPGTTSGAPGGRAAGGG
ncbi:MAG: aminomethyl-transferring glycine dehydrogenase subunit GcvPB [Acidimicrobiales bacterium]